jgi:cytochrome c553
LPRLAGQQTEYLTNQLQAFIDRRRTNPVMFNVAHVLSPAMLKALAEHFKDLNPKPLGGGPKDSLVAEHCAGKSSHIRPSAGPSKRSGREVPCA